MMRWFVANYYSPLVIRKIWSLMMIVLSLIILSVYVGLHAPIQHLSDFEGLALERPQRGYSRPKAALISLVRNSELAGIQQSIRQLEYRFNSNPLHRYPWVFFNDVPFTQDFIDGTMNLTSGGAHYEVIPKEHWMVPEWINQERFMSSLEYLGSVGVGKGWLVSYS